MEEYNIGVENIIDILIYIAPLAIIFFWIVGAISRLLQLRAKVQKAFTALDAQLLRQLAWVQGTLPIAIRGEAHTSPAYLQDEATASWARLHAASEQFSQTLSRARAKVISISSMSELVSAHEAMRSAWIDVMNNAIEPDAVPSAERLQERWIRLLHQSIPLRTAFNEAANNYNKAISQFPALILAKILRMPVAGTLVRMS